MKSNIRLLRELFTQAIKQLYNKECQDSAMLEAEITQSTQEHFGHYQCNSALKLSKLLKKNPRAVAEQICQKLEMKQSQEFSFNTEIAGPGFINIRLDVKTLELQLDMSLRDPRLGVPLPSHIQKVIVEYSSPNIAKELHVGHLRSTIIGESLARLLEFVGHHVTRLNHVGDWGTQFGMLIGYLKQYHPKVLTGEVPTDLEQLMGWYRQSKKLFDEDEHFRKKAHLEVVSLQKGEKESLKAWKIICEISRQGFQKIYQLLDVKLQERGESFYNPMLADIVKDFERKGLLSIDGGAKCVFLEGFINQDGQALPVIIQKSDGGYNYSTTDLAAIKHRIHEEKAERIIYVVDAGQSLHFQMLFKAAEKVGYLDPSKVKVEHVAFGVVLGADGKKFKTRSGETEKLIDLLTNAVDEAKKILEERLPHLEENKINELAEVLGIDAIKYADLSCHRLKDYMFSYDRMLKFEGNTAAFLLYAFVRIESIKRKVGKDIEQLTSSKKIRLTHPSEIALAVHLRQFSETLELMDQDLLPNRLTDYLYQLAEKFNAFFRDCRVEGSEEESSRLLLSELAGKILSKGLYILGLKTMDRM